ncbi:hypothetical protein [Prosthecobacter dejongeii]|uniref:Uncharacterized protein n=1 Tax=Prosthecobacter dejongeii TaxID=48465 RepID=A0A7W7YKH1_9BACT|nr:hypothetical protein [Prosthecobacter dejongeii]MBB5037873.1 hypothetical protein [Prosthecobacter dejongeii]
MMEEHLRSPEEIVESQLTIVERTYDSLKWPWLIIMSFSLTQAAKTCFEASSKGSNFREFIHFATVPLSIFCIAYLPTFLRYFIGDSRYIDLFAHDAKKAVSTARIDVLSRVFSRRRRVADTLMLVSQGLMFVPLGLSVANPHHFFWAYLILLALNIVWLWFVISCNSPTIREERGTLVIQHDSDKSPRRWLINNVIHLILLLFILLVGDGLNLPDFWKIALPLVFCFSNSLVDILLTHEFYFPKVQILFHQFYDEGKK